MKNTKKDIRVIFAAGGTGGHVYPAIAMYEGLVERLGEERVAALFVGTKGGLDNRMLTGRGFATRYLPGRGVRGASLSNKLMVSLDLARGVSSGIKIILGFSPDVVVGTGGYASVSMVIAAVMTRIPRVLQEQNSVPGLANRRLARFSDLVLLAFTESRSAIPGGADAAVIGNPLRRLPSPDRVAGARHFGIDPVRPTILVFGGSRGARSLNLAAVEAAKKLAVDGYQFILLTGELEWDRTRNAIEGWGSDVVVRAYEEEINHAYSAADVAVARAGASSVFELAAFGVPAILVPYPHAADDHQRSNAEALRKAGGAVIIADSDLTGERLKSEIESMLGNARLRDSMREAQSNWVGEDAALAAADRIIELVRAKRPSGR